MSKDINKSGFIALIGRPNVGKSTLLNYMLGQKISITSHKPQTTRHRILGIKTENGVQAIYIDTPGLHSTAKNAMNRYMNKTAKNVLHEVDVVIFLVEAGCWTKEDASVVDKLKQVKAPVVMVVNKVDTVKDKGDLLPFIKDVSGQYEFSEVLPVSAMNGEGVERLEQIVADLLPEGPALYSEEQVTDKTERFMAAELIREKLMRTLRQEIPYSLTVEIENFELDTSGKKEILNIGAVIWVERPGQKGIVIGKDGENLKSIGKQARIDMEKSFDHKVFLNLWVKVKDGWSDNERILKSLGYNDEGC
ncbi:MAG: GTPase Era [Gammaproteobacteria bacterium]|nr:GTPase Era [Gammaproteobacteria bacterium]